MKEQESEIIKSDLSPGGPDEIKINQPPDTIKQHDEVLKKIDEIQVMINQLKRMLDK